MRKETIQEFLFQIRMRENSKQDTRHETDTKTGRFPALYHKEWDEKKPGNGNNLSIFTYHHIWPTVRSHIDDVHLTMGKYHELSQFTF